MSSLPKRLSIGLIICVLALAIYRAKVQSFTIDEAFTFHLYVDRPLAAFLTSFDACNHVLHTLLTKFIRYWLGTSELVLRIGSLIGALLYLSACYQLTRLWLGSGWLQLTALAALALNPLVVDFMVAARGYGLALGLFFWAMYYVCLYLDGRNEEVLLWRAGVLAGLSVAANLTLAIPVAVFSAILLFALARREFRTWLDAYAGPALVTAFLIVVLPLSRAKPESFYFGSSALADAYDTLWDYSVAYAPERSLLQSLNNATVEWIEFRFVPALLVGILAAGVWALVRWARGSADRLQVGLVLCSFTMAGAIGALVLANLMTGMRLPNGRTGLYLVPLFTASLILAAASLRKMDGLSSTTGNAGVGLTLLLVGLYAAQFNTSYFVEWRFDASTNKVMAMIASDYKARASQGRVRIGASWLFDQSIEYYRKRRRLGWLETVISEKLESAQADYYVLSGQDTALVEKLGLRVLHRDKLSGAVLASRT